MFIPRNNEISSARLSTPDKLVIRWILFDKSPAGSDLHDFKPWHDLLSNKIFYFDGYEAQRNSRPVERLVGR